MFQLSEPSSGAVQQEASSYCNKSSRLDDCPYCRSRVRALSDKLKGNENLAIMSVLFGVVPMQEPSMPLSEKEPSYTRVSSKEKCLETEEDDECSSARIESIRDSHKLGCYSDSSFEKETM